MLRARSTTVAARRPPSRWSCSNTLGAARISSKLGICLFSHLGGGRAAAEPTPGAGDKERRPPLAAYPVDDRGGKLGAVLADLEGVAQGGQPGVEPGLVVGAQLQQRLPLLHPVARFGQA